MRTIALLATYNERRFIRNCLEHLLNQGIEVYVIDNASTDATLDIVHEYLGHGVIGIETLPRAGMYSWQPILRRKEQLALELPGDWFMHVDADEIRLPPYPGKTLAETFAAIEHAGYNAVNFQEFTFVPTAEEPDHDHSDYLLTLRWYYPFLPSFPHRLNAWSKQPSPVDLAGSGGHRVQFPGLSMYPQSFPMKHYLFLSPAHAIEKYVHKVYDPAELAIGWHGGRASLKPESIALPHQQQLRQFTTDQALDATDPLTQHFLFRQLESQ